MTESNKKILIVVTNYLGNENTDPNAIKGTGVYLEEFAVPYLVFEATGYDITVASPKGGIAPVDEKSLSCSNPQEWDKCIEILRNTKKLSDIDYRNFDVLYLPGGHGPMFDLAFDSLLKEVVEYFYANDKIISAVCHGPAGLVLAKDEFDSILKGKKVTALTNTEEHITKTDESVPFLLETKLKELGADFEESEPWTEHVCVDAKLITGQNPQSALLLAEKVVQALC